MKFGIASLADEEQRQAARELVDSFDENEGIPSKRFFWFSVTSLLLFIACLAGQSELPWDLDKLEMGFIALFFAGAVLWAYRHEVDKFYAAVDWDLLAFFAALFVVIHTMEYAQVLAMMGGGIAKVLELNPNVASGVPPDGSRLCLLELDSPSGQGHAFRCRYPDQIHA